MAEIRTLLTIVRLWSTLLFLLGSAASLGRCAVGQIAPEPKSILTVFPFDSHTPVQEGADWTFRRSMLKDTQPVQFFTEDLDLIRFPDQVNQEKLFEYLHVRYAGQKINLIVCFSFPALQFWNRYGTRLFPKTPVLFMGVEKRRLQEEPLQSSMAGLTFTFNDELLLNTILHLHPQTRHVFLAGGTTKFERYWMAQRLSSLKASHPELSYEDLSNLPEPNLTSTLRHLPPGSVVLFQDLYRTASGRNLQEDEGVQLVCRAANAPVYGFFVNYIGKGLTGGLVIDPDTGGRAAAMGRRLLSGESPASVGILDSTANRFLFDWRQLKRWGIAEKQLPPGSGVLYRQPSFWSLYKWRILFVAVLCFTESVLLLGLLAQRQWRRKADAAVQQLSGQLIDAQEQERARIARELHDDIGQQVAALGIGLHMLETKMTEAPVQAREVLPKIEQRLYTLAGSIRHLSHELHPAVLEYAGLSAALRAHCAEFRELTGISVNLGFQPDPLALPRDVSLCLYRISQESLRNTAKHSGAQYVRLHVNASNSAVELVITDDGSGFNAEASAVRTGLGLKSMAERVRLLNGSFQVNSRPRFGTILKARIPLHGRLAVT